MPSGAHHPLLAREGWRFAILLTATTLLLLQFSSPWLALTQLPLLGWILYSFRDPARDVAGEPRAVVAPIDGEVVEVGVQPEGWDGSPQLRIAILNGWNAVYSLRAPVAGLLQDAPAPAAPRAEGRAWVFHTDENQDVLLASSGGYWIGKRFSRNRCSLRFGQRMRRGEPCGTVPLQSRIELYLRADAEPRVSPGQRVLAGEDVLASFPEGGDQPAAV